VRRLGGELTATNRPEGGAEFRLSFPEARPSEPPGSEGSLSRDPEEEASGTTGLAVARDQAGGADRER
jgi:hypothetical protein